MTEKDDDAVATVAGSARMRLGHSELTVRPVGMGCMGMSQFYGRADDRESIETIRSAIDLGVNFLDTSDIYGAADIAWTTDVRGFGHNEQLDRLGHPGPLRARGAGDGIRGKGQRPPRRDRARRTPDRGL
jgi:hypothetical protein